MISSKHCAHIKFIEIATCWSKLVFTSIHHLGKCFFFKPHSNSSHFSYSIASLNHMATPSIHYVFKLWKIFRSLIWISFRDWIISADIPEVSPFCIEGRGTRSERFIGVRIVFKTGSMIFCFLSELWSCTNLKIIFWIDIPHWPMVVMIFWSTIKEPFHHIKELSIFRLFNPGIINN